MFNLPLAVHKKLLFGFGIAIFVLAGFVWLVWNIWEPRMESGPPSVLPALAELPAIATTSSPIAPSLSETLPYQGEPVHIMEADPEVLKQIPAETYEKSKAELAELAVKLAENPRQANDWMRVAYIKRFYHDYAGSRDAYEYLNLIASGDPIPFYNLGALYGYYLKEPQKAIPKYQAALERDLSNSSFYSGFADFYREVLGDLPSAERVLLQGLAKVPTDINIQISLGALYKTMGNTARAVEYYEKVLATNAISESQRLAIQEELERLKPATGY